MDILPRFIRHRDAPAYLGVDRNKFDAEIRPYLTAIPLGKRSLAFDRLELDAWADNFKARFGRPGRLMQVAAPAQDLPPAPPARAAEKVRRTGKPKVSDGKPVSRSNLERARDAISATRASIARGEK